MKAPRLSFALLLTAWTGLAAGMVEQGASLQAVKAELGTPRGEMKLGGRHVLYYDRGEVELQNGALIRLDLRSTEEQEVLVTRQERLRNEAETRREQMRLEGSALRDRKLADAAFLAAPVGYQLAFWEDFTRRYPEVSCAEPLYLVRLRLTAQHEDQRRRDEQAERLAALEERYAAAERQPTVYPLFTSSPYRYRHRSHHHEPFALGPVTYTFYDAPLPPYTTPAGNPAGNLTGPIFNLPASNPALPARYDKSRSRWERDDRGNRSGWKQGDRGNRSVAHRSRGRS